MSDQTTPADVDARRDTARPGYAADMSCRNCGWTGSVEYDCGRALDHVFGERCPNCECRYLHRRKEMVR